MKAVAWLIGERELDVQLFVAMTAGCGVGLSASTGPSLVTRLGDYSQRKRCQGRVERCAGRFMEYHSVIFRVTCAAVWLKAPLHNVIR